MQSFYTNEEHIQVLIALLKAHNIKRVIASPGATNVTFIRSLQNDPFFKIYSVVDERSAAYMACGMAAESSEPVVLSCTGATSSRNYLPGLTEAFYRKLPVLAVTSTQNTKKIGHHIAQVIDRSVLPNDVVNFSTELCFIKDEDDRWACEIDANKAILELKRNGGGPVHINLPTNYCSLYETKKLPKVRKILRVTDVNDFPEIKDLKVAISVGSHLKMTQELSNAIDHFCGVFNAVVFCDHTSGYQGKYKVIHSLSSSQKNDDFVGLKPDLTISIGEITGDYSMGLVLGKSIWRVNKDGQLRDPYRRLELIFEMFPLDFFKAYSNFPEMKHSSYFNEWREHVNNLRLSIPDIPFSSIWVAKQCHDKLPENSVIHFGILHTLRSWNFFDLPHGVDSYCNVGGFGIDGCVSSLLGASFESKDKLYFGVVGDLAFFYDMNSIGNRHVGNNVRLMIVNNGKGTEFRNAGHHAAVFGESSDTYHAAAGHFGDKSQSLLKNYSESLGFEYLTASDKDEFENVYAEFFSNDKKNKPILFEVFTDSDKESEALELVTLFSQSFTKKTKNSLKNVLGSKGTHILKKLVKR